LDEPEILTALRVAAHQHPTRPSEWLTAPSRDSVSSSLIAARTARRLYRPASPQLRPAARSPR
jgi:hypothetical protein